MEKHMVYLFVDAVSDMLTSNCNGTETKALGDNQNSLKENEQKKITDKHLLIIIKDYLSGHIFLKYPQCGLSKDVLMKLKNEDYLKYCIIRSNMFYYLQMYKKSALGYGQVLLFFKNGYSGYCDDGIFLNILCNAIIVFNTYSMKSLDPMFNFLTEFCLILFEKYCLINKLKKENKKNSKNPVEVTEKDFFKYIKLYIKKTYSSIFKNEKNAKAKRKENTSGSKNMFKVFDRYNFEDYLQFAELGDRRLLVIAKENKLKKKLFNIINLQGTFDISEIKNIDFINDNLSINAEETNMEENTQEKTFGCNNTNIKDTQVIKNQEQKKIANVDKFNTSHEDDIVMKEFKSVLASKRNTLVKKTISDIVTALSTNLENKELKKNNLHIPDNAKDKNKELDKMINEEKDAKVFVENSSKNIVDDDIVKFVKDYKNIIKKKSRELKKKWAKNFFCQADDESPSKKNEKQIKHNFVPPTIMQQQDVRETNAKPHKYYEKIRFIINMYKVPLYGDFFSALCEMLEVESLDIPIYYLDNLKFVEKGRKYYIKTSSSSKGSEAMHSPIEKGEPLYRIENLEKELPRQNVECLYSYSENTLFLSEVKKRKMLNYKLTENLFSKGEEKKVRKRKRKLENENEIIKKHKALTEETVTFTNMKEFESILLNQKWDREKVELENKILEQLFFVKYYCENSAIFSELKKNNSENTARDAFVKTCEEEKLEWSKHVKKDFPFKKKYNVLNVNQLLLSFMRFCFNKYLYSHTAKKWLNDSDLMKEFIHFKMYKYFTDGTNFVENGKASFSFISHIIADGFLSNELLSMKEEKKKLKTMYNFMSFKQYMLNSESDACLNKVLRSILKNRYYAKWVELKSVPRDLHFYKNPNFVTFLIECGLAFGILNSKDLMWDESEDTFLNATNNTMKQHNNEKSTNDSKKGIVKERPLLQRLYDNWKHNKSIKERNYLSTENICKKNELMVGKTMEDFMCPDEVSPIDIIQFRISDSLFLNLNNANFYNCTFSGLKCDDGNVKQNDICKKKVSRSEILDKLYSVLKKKIKKKISIIDVKFFDSFHLLFSNSNINNATKEVEKINNFISDVFYLYLDFPSNLHMLFFKSIDFICSNNIIGKNNIMENLSLIQAYEVYSSRFEILHDNRYKKKGAFYKKTLKYDIFHQGLKIEPVVVISDQIDLKCHLYMLNLLLYIYHKMDKRRSKLRILKLSRVIKFACLRIENILIRNVYFLERKKLNPFYLCMSLRFYYLLAKAYYKKVCLLFDEYTQNRSNSNNSAYFQVNKENFEQISEEENILSTDTSEEFRKNNSIEKDDVDKKKLEKGNFERENLEKGNFEKNISEQGNLEKGKLEKNSLDKYMPDKNNLEQSNLEKENLKKMDLTENKTVKNFNDNYGKFVNKTDYENKRLTMHLIFTLLALLRCHHKCYLLIHSKEFEGPFGEVYTFKVLRNIVYMANDLFCQMMLREIPMKLKYIIICNYINSNMHRTQKISKRDLDIIAMEDTFFFDLIAEIHTKNVNKNSEASKDFIGSHRFPTYSSLAYIKNIHFYGKLNLTYKYSASENEWILLKSSYHYLIKKIMKIVKNNGLEHLLSKWKNMIDEKNKTKKEIVSNMNLTVKDVCNLMNIRFYRMCLDIQLQREIINFFYYSIKFLKNHKINEFLYIHIIKNTTHMYDLIFSMFYLRLNAFRNYQSDVLLFNRFSKNNICTENDSGLLKIFKDLGFITFRYGASYNFLNHIFTSYHVLQHLLYLSQLSLPHKKEVLLSKRVLTNRKDQNETQHETNGQMPNSLKKKETIKETKNVTRPYSSEEIFKIITYLNGKINSEGAYDLGLNCKEILTKINREVSTNTHKSRNSIVEILKQITSKSVLNEVLTSFFSCSNDTVSSNKVDSKNDNYDVIVKTSKKHVQHKRKNAYNYAIMSWNTLTDLKRKKKMIKTRIKKELNECNTLQEKKKTHDNLLIYEKIKKSKKLIKTLKNMLSILEKEIKIENQRLQCKLQFYINNDVKLFTLKNPKHSLYYSYLNQKEMNRVTKLKQQMYSKEPLFFKPVPLSSIGKNDEIVLNMNVTLENIHARSLFLLLSILYTENINSLYLAGVNYFKYNEVYNTYYIFRHVANSITFLLSSPLTCCFQFVSTWKPHCRYENKDVDEDFKKEEISFRDSGSKIPKATKKELNQISKETLSSQWVDLHIITNINIKEVNGLRINTIGNSLKKKKGYTKKARNEYICEFCMFLEALLQMSIHYLTLFRLCVVNNAEGADYRFIMDMFNNADKSMDLEELMETYDNVNYICVSLLSIMTLYKEHFTLKRNELYNMKKCMLDTHYFVINILLTTCNTHMMNGIERYFLILEKSLCLKTDDCMYKDTNKNYTYNISEDIKMVAKNIYRYKSPFNSVFSHITYYLNVIEKENFHRAVQACCKNTTNCKFFKTSFSSLRKDITIKNKQKNEDSNTADVKDKLKEEMNLKAMIRITTNLAIPYLYLNNIKILNGLYTGYVNEEDIVHRKPHRENKNGSKVMQKEKNQQIEQTAEYCKQELPCAYYYDLSDSEAEYSDDITKEEFCKNDVIRVLYRYYMLVFGDYMDLKKGGICEDLNGQKVVEKKKSELLQETNIDCISKYVRLEEDELEERLQNSSNIIIQVMKDCPYKKIENYLKHSIYYNDIKVSELILGFYLTKYIEEIKQGNDEDDGPIHTNIILNQFFCMKNKVDICSTNRDYVYFNAQVGCLPYKLNQYQMLHLLSDTLNISLKRKLFLHALAKWFELKIEEEIDQIMEYIDPFFFSIYIGYVKDLFLNGEYDYYYYCGYVRSAFLMTKTKSSDKRFDIANERCYNDELLQLVPVKLKMDFQKKVPFNIENKCVFLLEKIRTYERKRTIEKSDALKNKMNYIDIEVVGNASCFSEMYHSFRNKLYRILRKKKINYLKLIKILNEKPNVFLSNMISDFYLYTIEKIKCDYTRDVNFNAKLIIEKLELALKVFFFDSKNVELYCKAVKYYITFYKFLETIYIHQFVIPESLESNNKRNDLIKHVIHGAILYKKYYFIKYIYLIKILKHINMLTNVLIYIYYKYFCYHKKTSTQFSHFTRFFVNIHTKACMKIKSSKTISQQSFGDYIHDEEKFWKKIGLVYKSDGYSVLENYYSDSTASGTSQMRKNRKVVNYCSILSYVRESFVKILHYKITINANRIKLKQLNPNGNILHFIFFKWAYIKYIFLTNGNRLEEIKKEKNKKNRIDCSDSCPLKHLKEKYLFYSLSAIEQNVRICLYVHSLYFNDDMLKINLPCVLDISHKTCKPCEMNISHMLKKLGKKGLAKIVKARKSISKKKISSPLKNDTVEMKLEKEEKDKSTVEKVENGNEHETIILEEVRISFSQTFNKMKENVQKDAVCPFLYFFHMLKLYKAVMIKKFEKKSCGMRQKNCKYVYTFYFNLGKGYFLFLNSMIAHYMNESQEKKEKEINPKKFIRKERMRNAYGLYDKLFVNLAISSLSSYADSFSVLCLHTLSRNVINGCTKKKVYTIKEVDLGKAEENIAHKEVSQNIELRMCGCFYLQPSYISTKCYIQCLQRVLRTEKSEHINALLEPLYKLLVTRLKICIYYPEYFFLACIHSYNLETLNPNSILKVVRSKKFYRKRVIVYLLSKNPSINMYLNESTTLKNRKKERVGSMEVANKEDGIEFIGNIEKKEIGTVGTESCDDKMEKRKNCIICGLNYYNKKKEYIDLKKYENVYLKHSRKKIKQTRKSCTGNEVNEKHNFVNDRNSSDKVNELKKKKKKNKLLFREWKKAGYDTKKNKKKISNIFKKQRKLKNKIEKCIGSPRKVCPFLINTERLCVLINNRIIYYKDVIEDILNGLNVVFQNGGDGHYGMMAAYYICYYYVKMERYDQCIKYMFFFLQNELWKQRFKPEQAGNDCQNIFNSWITRYDFNVIKCITLILEHGKRLLRIVLEKIKREREKENKKPCFLLRKSILPNKAKEIFYRILKIYPQNQENSNEYIKNDQTLSGLEDEYSSQNEITRTNDENHAASDKNIEISCVLKERKKTFMDESDIYNESSSANGSGNKIEGENDVYDNKEKGRRISRGNRKNSNVSKKCQKKQPEENWHFLGYQCASHLNELHLFLQVAFELYTQLCSLYKKHCKYETLEAATKHCPGNFSIISVLLDKVAYHLLFHFEILIYFTPDLLTYPMLVLFSNPAEFEKIWNEGINKELVISHNIDTHSVDLRILKMFSNFYSMKPFQMYKDLMLNLDALHEYALSKFFYYELSDQEIESALKESKTMQCPQTAVEYLHNMIYTDNKVLLSNFLNQFDIKKSMTCDMFLKSEDLKHLSEIIQNNIESSLYYIGREQNNRRSKRNEASNNSRTRRNKGNEKNSTLTIMSDINNQEENKNLIIGNINNTSEDSHNDLHNDSHETSISFKKVYLLENDNSNIYNIYYTDFENKELLWYVKLMDEKVIGLSNNFCLFKNVKYMIKRITERRRTTSPYLTSPATSRKRKGESVLNDFFNKLENVKRSKKKKI